MDLVEVVRARLPELHFDVATVVDDGWDSVVVELDETWIVRFPRRAEVEQGLERELRLLPELAPTLPVAVPRIELVVRNGLVCVAYRKLEGAPARSGLDASTGADLGRFLAALHRFPVERARALDVPYYSPDAWRERLGRLCAAFRERVCPLLDPGERAQAETVFACVTELDFEPVLLHADLGPSHVLCRDARVVGVIDWSDARVGDRALDLAWCLNGTQLDVAHAAAGVYGADDDLWRRSLFYHRLGPWYEVVHGFEANEREFVTSGLEGVRARLPVSS